MNLLADFLGINELKKLKRENLAIQELADKTLTDLSGTCPETVAAFLLASRAVSRRAQEGVLDAGLGEVREAMKKEAEDSIEHYRDVLSMGCHAIPPLERPGYGRGGKGPGTTPCQSLRALTEKMTASPAAPKGPTPPDVPGPGDATALRTLPPRLRGLGQSAPG